MFYCSPVLYCSPVCYTVPLFVILLPFVLHCYPLCFIVPRCVKLLPGVLYCFPVCYFVTLCVILLPCVLYCSPVCCTVPLCVLAVRWWGRQWWQHPHGDRGREPVLLCQTAWRHSQGWVCFYFTHIFPYRVSSVLYKQLRLACFVFFATWLWHTWIIIKLWTFVGIL